MASFIELIEYSEDGKDIVTVPMVRPDRAEYWASVLVGMASRANPDAEYSAVTIVR